MGRPTVIIELGDDAQLARDLAAGGVFAPTCTLVFDEDCDLIVRGPGGELGLAARVVYVAPTGGAGLEIVGFNAAIKDQLARLVREVDEVDEVEAEAPGDAVAPLDPGAEDDADGESESESEQGGGGDGADGSDDAGDSASIDSEHEGETGDEARANRRHSAIPRNVQERLRGLTLAQQVKLATQGTSNERVVLERMYGKNVWEPLLRNPRLTAPEVARIARMGALPRILLEAIVNNGAWLQIPEVRRALLGNPRLETNQILRVLRLLPKHEIKLAAITTAYPFAVRDAAKKLVRNDE
jgi:hypothetical protein